MAEPVRSVREPLYRFDLFPYQQRGVDFIKEHHRCALWMEMGLGKTVSALTAFDELHYAGLAKHALVTAPLRVARKVWPDELQVWDHLHDLRISCMHGLEKNRHAALNAEADLHTVNVENVMWLVDQHVQGKKQIRKWPWDVVFLDESQGYMSQSSERYKSMKRILRKWLNIRVVELTGTPAPNGYSGLWSQYCLLDGGQRLGTAEDAYRNRWFDADMGDGYVRYKLKAHAKSQIQEAIADITMAMRVEDYFDLPPVTYNPIRVRMSPAAMAKYKKMERQYLFETPLGKLVTAVNAGVCYGKLLQLANGSIYVDDKGNYEPFHDEKINALLELLDGVSGPTIIGYGFKADARRIGAALDKFCGKSKTWAFAKSDEDMNRFARGELDFLVCHPGSAGHGLNDLYLSGSETLIWFGLTNNLGLFQQLCGRLIGGLRRIGRKVVIHLIITEDTKDEHTMELLTGKAADQDDLTRAVRDFRLAL